MTAGMLCLGSVGLSGVENVLKSVGTVLSASAEESAETERVPVGTGTTTVRVGTGTTQLEYQAFDDDTVEITDCDNEAAGELEIPAEIDGKPVRLTKKEIEILWTLAANTNKVFSRDALLDKLWGFDFYGDSRTVDSHIKRLRAKLDEHPHEGWDIETIWGVGYKFAVK